MALDSAGYIPKCQSLLIPKPYQGELNHSCKRIPDKPLAGWPAYLLRVTWPQSRTKPLLCQGESHNHARVFRDGVFTVREYFRLMGGATDETNGHEDNNKSFHLIISTAFQKSLVIKATEPSPN